MEQWRIAISLIILAVIASGCTDSSTGKAIQVSSVTVQPRSIYEGSIVSVSLSALNAGKTPASIDLGVKGQRVLTNHCPGIFNVKSFSFNKPGDDGRPVKLKSGQKIMMQWTLQQHGDVPTYNYRCNLDFQIPFNYSVTAYRQIQIKKNSRVKGSSHLSSKSSAGPLRFAIQGIGTGTSMSSTYVLPRKDRETKKKATILIQLQNTGSEDYNKGLVDINEVSLSIRASEPLELNETFSKENGELKWKSVKASYDKPRCNLQKGEEIRLFEGDSRLITCSVPLPKRKKVQPANISEITASVNYTYIEDLGSQKVEVKNREN